MRYIVIGAGAIGGAIGARLFQSGHSVVLVARGEHLRAITVRGLEFATPTATSTLPIPAVAGPDELTLRPDDVLLLSVKLQDAAALLDVWSVVPVAGGRTAGEELPLFCAQNGVEGERLALRRFARVYGVCVRLPAGHLTPGRITAEGDPWTGVLTLGRYPAGVDEVCRAVSADLEASRIGAPVSGEVMRWKYTKLLANLGNALEAVCGSVDDPAAAQLLRLATAEGEAVFAAAGIDWAGPAEEAAVRTRLRLTEIPGEPRRGGSSWQSLTRGTRSIEADYLSGEIVLLGRLHGVPTPVNETLRRLANDSARLGLAPGSTTSDQVAALLE